MGDSNMDGLLEAGETWKFQDAAHAALAGQHTNLGTVTGQDNFTDAPVSDSNPANYFGDAPAIQIVKYVNGEDANSAPGVHVPAGSGLTFTYDVTAVGSNVPIKNVSVSDDNAAGLPSTRRRCSTGRSTWATATWMVCWSRRDLEVPGRRARGVGGAAHQSWHGHRPGQLTDAPVSDSNPANYFTQGSVFVIGPDKSPCVPQEVKVIDESTGVVLAHFLPYEPDFVRRRPHCHGRSEWGRH